jgi:ATP-binding cassette subfamily B protein
VRGLVTALVHAVAMVWGASPFRVLVLLGVQLLSALSLLASVLLIDRVLEAALLVGRGEASVSRAVLPVVLLALVTTLTGVATAASNLQMRVLGALVERAVWRDVLAVTGSVGLDTFDDSDFYDQASRVEDRAGWQTRVVVQALSTMVGDGLGVVAGTIALLSLSPLLAPVLLLAGVPLLVTSRLSGRREFAFAVDQSRPYRERTYLQDVLTHREEAKEVRAFGLADALSTDWETSYGRYVADLRRHVSGLVRLSLTGGLGSALLIGTAMVLAVVLVGRGDLGVAEAGAALVAVRLLAGRVSGATRGVSQLFEASLFLQDLDSFRGRARNVGSTPPLPPAPEAFDEIKVSSLTFRYPGATVPAVDGVDLRLRKGEVVALVGENGSGKTTLAKLLAGLYQPDAGTIAWDGVDVRQYEPASVRGRITVLFQDFVRYRFTARTNIGLGRADDVVTDAEIRCAAAEADADGFLSALPTGYGTVLSKEFLGGTDLSLGQWQRVALARALLRNAPLVILDEPSASLDARAEHDFFERVRARFAGRTLVLISHRLATVRFADRIYVLAGGRVVEEGTHAPLMRQRGVYAQLFQLQAQGYGLDPSTSDLLN